MFHCGRVRFYGDGKTALLDSIGERLYMRNSDFLIDWSCHSQCSSLPKVWSCLQNEAFVLRFPCSSTDPDGFYLRLFPRYCRPCMLCSLVSRDREAISYGTKRYAIHFSVVISDTYRISTGSDERLLFRVHAL